MAYLLTNFWPDGTEEQYDATLAAVTEAAGGRRPELLHAAGPTDGGYLIVAVYDSKETADAFVRDAVMSIMPIDGGLVGPPEQRSADIVHSDGLAG
jgi:hypothetical protein